MFCTFSPGADFPMRFLWLHSQHFLMLTLELRRELQDIMSFYILKKVISKMIGMSVIFENGTETSSARAGIHS